MGMVSSGTHMPISVSANRHTRTHREHLCWHSQTLARNQLLEKSSQFFSDSMDNRVCLRKQPPTSRGKHLSPGEDHGPPGRRRRAARSHSGPWSKDSTAEAAENPETNQSWAGRPRGRGKANGKPQPNNVMPRRENLQLSQRTSAMVLAMKRVAGRMALMSKGEMIPKQRRWERKAQWIAEGYPHLCVPFIWCHEDSQTIHDALKVQK